MYQNGYLHDSPSRFSAKSAIYTAAGCQHKIDIYKAAVLDAIQMYSYTRLPCVHIKSLFTRHPFKSKSGLYTLLPGVYRNRYLHGSRSRAKSDIYIMPGVYIKLLFTRQPFKSQIGYIHCCRVCYLHSSRSRANSR